MISKIKSPKPSPFDITAASFMAGQIYLFGLKLSDP
jgi:hypothetical protein